MTDREMLKEIKRKKPWPVIYKNLIADFRKRLIETETELIETKKELRDALKMIQSLHREKGASNDR